MKKEIRIRIVNIMWALLFVAFEIAGIIVIRMQTNNAKEFLMMSAVWGMMLICFIAVLLKKIIKDIWEL